VAQVADPSLLALLETLNHGLNGALDDLCDSGYNVVGLDWLHDAAEAMRIANGRVTIYKVRLTVAQVADPSLLALLETLNHGLNGGRNGRVVGLDWLHDAAEAMRIANGRVTIQGNADPGMLYGHGHRLQSHLLQPLRQVGGDVAQIRKRERLERGRRQCCRLGLAARCG
jgi:uroporphyrinogen-III decarboxylase